VADTKTGAVPREARSHTCGRERSGVPDWTLIGTILKNWQGGAVLGDCCLRDSMQPVCRENLVWLRIYLTAQALGKEL
jgi:hypothetical protein